MALQNNGSSRQYRFIISAYRRAILKGLHRKAALSGRGPGFIVALRAIVKRLHADPMVFGEALYNLYALSQQVRQGVIVPVAIDFAVHEESKLVSIIGSKLLS